MVYVVEPGTVQVMVGSSSQDLPCVGETTDVSAEKVFFCATEERARAGQKLV